MHDADAARLRGAAEELRANAAASLKIAETLAAIGTPPPEPEPPPPPAPRFEILPHDPASWRLGEVNNIAVDIVGYARWHWAYVSGGQGHPFVGGPVEGRGNTIPFLPRLPGDFCKAWPDGLLTPQHARDTARMPGERPAPIPLPPPQQPPLLGALNILVRGQSNALLFVQHGGAGLVEKALEQALEVPVNIVAGWGSRSMPATIHSGTPFMTWDTEGQQDSMLRFVAAMPPERRALPTVILWMHNEDDQNSAVTTADWLREVQADAVLLRKALGQSAATTPYVFVPVRFNFGNNRNWRTGMDRLAADPAFNASVCEAFVGTFMDGDGFENSSHMGLRDMAIVAGKLAPHVQPIAAKLVGKAAPLPQQPPPQPLPPPIKPEPKPDSGAALARAIKARAGIWTFNWERERFAVNFKYNQATHDYYSQFGNPGIRAFMPWDPSGFRVPDGSIKQFWDFKPRIPPTKEQFNRFRPNAEAIMRNKRVLHFDLLDVIGLEDDNGELEGIVDQYLHDACTWIKEWAIDPDYLILGPVNEWAGATNPEYEPRRLKKHSILRQHFPEPFVLGMAPCEWGHPASFVGEKIDGRDVGPYNPGTDAATVHYFHVYTRRSAAGWASWQAKIDAWEAANDRVVMCGEIGAGGLQDGADWLKGDGGWIAHWRRQNPAMAKSVPAVWAFTTGHWTVNRGAFDPRFYDASQIPAGGTKPWDPPIEQTFLELTAINRAARGL